VHTAAGRSDLASRLLLNETYPSWGYSIRHGATTIWERWDGWTETRGFQTPAMNSLNHCSFGAIGEWLRRSVAGIDQAREALAYDRIVIRPELGGGLTWAQATYHSVRGVIAAAWKRDRDRFELEIRVPANTSATIVLPSASVDSVLEGGRPLGEVDGVDVVGTETNSVVVSVGSGDYVFGVAPLWAAGVVADQARETASRPVARSRDTRRRNALVHQTAYGMPAEAIDAGRVP
jgi:alpha-L-rhamnosidase